MMGLFLFGCNLSNNVIHFDLLQPKLNTQLSCRYLVKQYIFTFQSGFLRYQTHVEKFKLIQTKHLEACLNVSCVFTNLIAFLQRTKSEPGRVTVKPGMFLRSSTWLPTVISSECATCSCGPPNPLLSLTCEYRVFINPNQNSLVTGNVSNHNYKNRIALLTSRRYVEI